MSAAFESAPLMPMTNTKTKTLMEKMARTLTLNKFDYDCVLNSHYDVSPRKLCSAYISIDSKNLPSCASYLIYYIKRTVFLSVLEISTTGN